MHLIALILLVDTLLLAMIFSIGLFGIKSGEIQDNEPSRFVVLFLGSAAIFNAYALFLTTLSIMTR